MGIMFAQFHHRKNRHLLAIFDHRAIAHLLVSNDRAIFWEARQNRDAGDFGAFRP